MAEPDPFLDALIERQVGIERLSASVARKVRNHLADVEQDLASQIAGQLAREATGRKPAESTLRRLGELQRAVQALSREAHAAIRKTVTSDGTKLAHNEVEHAAQLYPRFGIVADLKKPSAEMLKSVVISKPFQGKVLQGWTRYLDEATQDRIMSQIRLGITEGESIDQIIRRIVSPRSIKVGSGALDISKRSVEAMARTAVNHISNRAHYEFLRHNPGVFDRYQWVSILDRRTSSVCRSRSGEVYPIGGGPLPPAHPRCRSTISPIVKGEIADNRNVYEDWLRRQSVDAQDDVLGRRKAELFRAGRLSLRDAADLEGRPLTIEQIQARMAPFDRARQISTEPREIRALMPSNPPAPPTPPSGVPPLQKRIYPPLTDDDLTLQRKLVGASSQSIALWKQHIDTNPEDFVRLMFVDVEKKGFRLDQVAWNGNRSGLFELKLRILDASGTPVSGNIVRYIDLQTMEAYHVTLALRGPFQGQGLGKDILRSHIRTWREIGLKNVKVDATLDRGAYAWLKYGFLPEQRSWDTLRGVLGLELDLEDLHNAREIDDATFNAASMHLSNSDPRAAWAFVDMPFTDTAGNSLAKRLLHSKGWKGDLDLTDSRSLRRFYAYVR